MNSLKIFLPAGILVAGLLVNASLSHAKPEYTKKEGVGCVACHVKMGSKELNEKGKYYAEKKTLKGYVEKK